MEINIARTACAALLLSLTPIAGPAAAKSGAPHSGAIATGLAIPVGVQKPKLAAMADEIPARGRSILVDAASARLYMLEDGRPVDSMKVIVGKPSARTPAVKSLLYAATLNPYWHVPVDLAKSIIAPRVLKDGMSYLEERGYEVVSTFGKDARVLDASQVDWQAVADGEEKVFVRQRPGPANSMGQMKFGFANNNGIFLHDTPRKELFSEEDRDLSAGCVRLEDAERLASWLLGHEPELESAAPEQQVALPKPVPIVITYLDDEPSMHLAALR